MKSLFLFFLFVMFSGELGAMDVPTLFGSRSHSDSLNSSTITETVRQKLKDLILVKNISNSYGKIDSQLLSINGVAFSPDSQIFVAAHCSLTGPILKVRSSINNKALVEYKDDEKLSFKCIAFSNDGKTLLSGLAERLCFWDTASWKITREIFLETINASSLAFSKGGTKMIFGSQMCRNNLAIFTLGNKGRFIRFLSGHDEDFISGISAVGFSPDSTRAVSVSGSTCKVWDVDRGDMLYEVSGDSWSHCKIQYDEHDGWFLTGYQKGDDVLGYWFSYNLNTQAAIQVPLFGAILSEIKAYEQTTCGDYIFLGNAENGNVTVFNMRTKKHIYTIQNKGGAVSILACSPDGKSLIVGINEGIQYSLWSYNLMSDDDQKALLVLNRVDRPGLQFLQDILPKEETTMIVHEKILDDIDFKNLPQSLRTLFHRFIDRKNSSFDKSFININSDDGWSLID